MGNIHENEQTLIYKTINAQYFELNQKDLQKMYCIFLITKCQVQNDHHS